ncbi:DUF983 domain-containing protein [Ketogulonicigenium vulgare]|uniref:Zinc-finger protein n=1 Tax=Ketogulonicigenium vulgare (strain WSH-001) TaxID=759362 RepID=F9Y3D7_KETVW|nr:DUF983 domain-containing protein [Ketogulonicigenium vulgare]AEM40378.1 Zinc-finger protein [Ketogulonicigenium vulgare WSH-001]ALJ80566.1 hypothetical protein KVH_04880 [Ketogulonicigenium vulgare]ANW33387.1 hypothetical protein KvSKV_04850 [Ketogulonicigenium vulgare]
MTAETITPPQPMTAERPIGPALSRGWRRRCPACGKGKLLTGYLKVADHCPACGAEMFHQRADDGPAYLTILLVGHIMAVALHIVWSAFRPAPIVMALTFSIGVVLLALYLLPRIKGAFIGLQWSRKMHGFSDKLPD